MNKYRRFAILPVAMLVRARRASGRPTSEPATAGAAADIRRVVAWRPTYLDGDGDFCAGRQDVERRPTGDLCEKSTSTASRLDRPELRAAVVPDDPGVSRASTSTSPRRSRSRLGVEVEFVTPTLDLVQAGGWNGRWDISVGSITITEDRLDSWTSPSRTTSRPRRWRRRPSRGSPTSTGSPAQAVCVGAATTYLDWINGDLALGDGSESAPVPEGMTAVALETDAMCAEAIGAGREEFDRLVQLVDDGPAAIDCRHRRS